MLTGLNVIRDLRFFMAMEIQVVAFWVVKPCSDVAGYSIEFSLDRGQWRTLVNGAEPLGPMKGGKFVD